MHLRLWVLVVLAFTVLSEPAFADSGTGVGADPIVLGRPAELGHTYPLTGLYVVNTGTEASAYQVHLQPFSRGDSKTVPSSWVTFGRNSFSLKPHESTVVPMNLAVPDSAPAGAYLAYLVAATATPATTGGTALGAAAATELRFAVVRTHHASIGLGAVWRTPWLYFWLVAAAISSLVLLLQRSGVRLSVQRRR